jgi:serine/threonine-protein kinase RsbW
LGDSIKLRLPAAPEYVSLARLAAAEAAVRSGLDQEAVEDVRLAVSEACTNAVESSPDDGVVELTIEPGDVELSIEVSMGCAPEGGARTDGDAEAYGLELIRDLTDEFACDALPGGGTVLRFTKRASAT